MKLWLVVTAVLVGILAFYFWFVRTFSTSELDPEPEPTELDLWTS